MGGGGGTLGGGEGGGGPGWEGRVPRGTSGSTEGLRARASDIQNRISPNASVAPMQIHASPVAVLHS